MQENKPFQLSDLTKSRSAVIPIPDKKLNVIYEKMGQITSNDSSDYPAILSEVKEALINYPNSRVDYLKTINMWEKVELAFSVKEFCDYIGLEN